MSHDPVPNPPRAVAFPRLDARAPRPVLTGPAACALRADGPDRRPEEG